MFYHSQAREAFWPYFLRFYNWQLQNLTDSDDPCCLFAPAVPSLAAVRILVAIEGLSKCRVVMCTNASSNVMCITRESVARKRRASTQKLSLARCHVRWLATPASGQLQMMSGCIAPPVRVQPSPVPAASQGRVFHCQTGTPGPATLSSYEWD